MGWINGNKLETQKAKGRNVLIQVETVINLAYQWIFLVFLLGSCLSKTAAQGIPLNRKIVFLDLDKNHNINLSVASQEEKEVIILNILVENDHIKKNIGNAILPPSFREASLLISIYLLPKFGTKTKPSLSLVNEGNVSFISQQFLERNMYERINTYLKNDNYFDNRTSEFRYIFKIKDKCYESEGKCLTECFLLKDFGTLYPNENDFVTINMNSKVFSKEDFKAAQKEAGFSTDSDKIIFNNLFSRIFIGNYQTNPFHLWVSPQKFHRDFGVERTDGIVYDSEWYEEGDYDFLYEKNIGIVGRQFNLFFKNPTFVKSAKKDLKEVIKQIEGYLSKQ